MGALQESNIAIGIVSDPCNYAAEQLIEKLLGHIAGKCPDCSRYQLTPDALTHGLSSDSAGHELREKLDKNYRVVVAILGVPDASGYASEVHQLLDIWEKSSSKPSLLLVSNNPELTRKAVTGWQGWNKLPDSLKSAIKINDEYLVTTNSHKALDALKERVQNASEVQSALIVVQQAKDEQAIQPLVASPVFARSRSLISHPYIVKG